MKITFTQYINNPLGEKSSVITNRGMYQELYKNKLDKILLREGGKVKYTLYKNKDKYYVHFKIPSEVVDKFYYDTIIEFYTDDAIVAKSQNLNNYYVKFYSNDPAFVYTFGHAFIKNDIFISDLLPKMTTEAKKKVAKEKNPDNLVGYVKSLFFAYLLMKDYGLFSKTMYDHTAEKYSKTKLLKTVDHAKDKIRDRQEAGDRERKKKRRDENNSKRLVDRNITHKSTASNKIKTTSKVTSAVKSRNIKRTKKI